MLAHCLAKGRITRHVGCIERRHVELDKPRALLFGDTKSPVHSDQMRKAKLAREAEMHYVTLGWVTDYDCWHVSEAPVTVEAVLAVLKKNTETANMLLAKALPGIADMSAKASCGCASSLSFGLVTDRGAIAPSRVAELGPLVRKYLR